MKFYWLALGTLAVWRVTHVLNAEDGPGEVVVRLRKSVGRGFWSDLLDCFYCLSVWVAAPIAWWLGEGWKERLLLWLALSAASILLERLSSPHPEEKKSEDGGSAIYFEAFERKEEDYLNVMLRKEARGIADSGQAESAPKSRL